MITAIIFLFILTLLVFVHELGHFLAAKIVGARVDEFAIGFPPKIFSFRIGETLYAANWVPFGGYVKILGEDAYEGEVDEAGKPVNFDTSRSLSYKPRIAQVAVMAAGVTCNVIFAWVLLVAAFCIGIPSSSQNFFDLPVSNPHVSVISVSKDSPAEKAGIAAGVTIVSVVAGTTTLDAAIKPLVVSEIQSAINNAPGEVMISYINPAGNFETALITPSSSIVEGRKVIGISMEEIGLIKLPFFAALSAGAKATYFMTVNTFEALAGFFGGLIHGGATAQTNLTEISGPIGIAKMVGEARAFGFAYLLSLTALISLNLALINIMPLPALDGGRIVVIAIEGIIRRPLNPRAVNLTHSIGFILLIGLMIAITWKDIAGLF